MNGADEPMIRDDEIAMLVAGGMSQAAAEEYFAVLDDGAVHGGCLGVDQPSATSRS